MPSNNATPKPNVLIPEYPYEQLYHNDQQQMLLHEDDIYPIDSTSHSDDRTSEIAPTTHYILHVTDESDERSMSFYKLQRIVKYGIYFDMVASFLYFVFNPYFIFYAFFNLFVSLGLYGINHYEASYLGSYAIYMLFKIASSIGFFAYVCIHHSNYVVANNTELNNDAFIWFCTTYTILTFVYVYFYVNLLKYIRFVTQ